MATAISGLPDFTPSLSLLLFEETIGDSPIAGAIYTVRLILQNLGSVSGTALGRLYINDALVLYGSDMTMNPGGRADRIYDWTPKIGTYTFKWVADEQNAISELDETNNVVTKTVTVSGLASYSLNAASSSVNEGSTATFTLTTNLASGTSDLEQKYDTSLYKKSEAEVNMIGKVKIDSKNLIMEDLRRLLVKKGRFASFF
jgi:hypothetical protein